MCSCWDLPLYINNVKWYWFSGRELWTDLLAEIIYWIDIGTLVNAIIYWIDAGILFIELDWNKWYSVFKWIGYPFVNVKWLLAGTYWV